MALAAYQTQGLGAAYTFQPVAWERTKEVASYCPIGNTSRCIPFNSHHHPRIVRRTALGPVLRVNYQCLKDLTFQDDNKKNDSSGREGMEEAEKSSLQSAQGSGWFTKLQKKSVIQRAKEILQSDHMIKQLQEAQFLDKDQMIKQLQKVQLHYNILEFCKSSDVWIKWPLAIFFPCYFAITVLFGVHASNDLLPLWIIGPLMMGIFIKSCQIVYALCIRITTSVVIMAKAGTAIFIAAKSDNITQAMQLQFEQHLEDKRSELVDYFKSGRFKIFLKQKHREYQEWISEAKQDYVESHWPQWRATLRFLKKIS